MKQLLTALPYIHLTHTITTLLLLAVFLVRTYHLFHQSKQATAKNLVSTTSLLIIIVFITGIMQAFLLKMPFNSPFVLTKIFGFLAFTGFGITAFMPKRKRKTALILMVFAFIIFIYTFFVAR